jgi:hypothetical protein
MEKTLQFALNEALEIGRQSAMPEFLEMELREKIAQEIESHIDSDSEARAFTLAADIARGKR